MTNTLSNDVQESIKKNLPQMVGQELQEYISQAELATKALAIAKDTIKELRSEVARYKTLDQEYCDMAHRERALEQAEAAIKAKDQALDKHVLEIKLQSMQNERDNATAMAMGLVRNTEFKRSNFSSVPLQSFYNNNGHINAMTQMHESANKSTEEAV